MTITAAPNGRKNRSHRKAYMSIWVTCSHSDLCPAYTSSKQQLCSFNLSGRKRMKSRAWMTYDWLAQTETRWAEMKTRKRHVRSTYLRVDQPQRNLSWRHSGAGQQTYLWHADIPQIICSWRYFAADQMNYSRQYSTVDLQRRSATPTLFMTVFPELITKFVRGDIPQQVTKSIFSWLYSTKCQQICSWQSYTAGQQTSSWKYSIVGQETCLWQYCNVGHKMNLFVIIFQSRSTNLFVTEIHSGRRRDNIKKLVSNNISQQSTRETDFARLFHGWSRNTIVTIRRIFYSRSKTCSWQYSKAGQQTFSWQNSTVRSTKRARDSITQQVIEPLRGSMPQVGR